MYRSRKDIKLENSAYMFCVYAFVALNYACYLTLFLPNIEDYDFKIAAAVIFHVFFIMLNWSLARCIISDPGKVPVFWGFFFDDNESKKRRYCLICHIFKVFNIYIY
jgi:palmitoyltransferase